MATSPERSPPPARPHLPRDLDGGRPAGLSGASTPTLFAVDVARRVVHASGRARRDACLSAHCGCPFSHDFARRFPFEQVRLTSVYSKGDGVVHWHARSSRTPTALR